MHETQIVNILSSLRKPVSIAEVRDTLARQLRKRIPYETVKRDMMALAAKGEIQSKSIGSGRRVSWIFWATEAQTEPAAVHETDPFTVTAADRDAMDPKQLSKLYDILLAKYESMISNALKSGPHFLVLCNGKVIHSSDSEIPDEELSGLEQRYGKACYVVTMDRIEEALWSSIDDDYYPTVEIFLGPANWRDDELFDHGLRTLADFDTGNPDVAAFSHEDLIGLRLDPAKFLRRGIHLGRYYDYYLLQAKIGIQDINGKRKCIIKACRSVMWWQQTERNPFLLANPGRNGFLGRDLMIKFPLSILLSGKEKCSRTYLA